MCFYLPTERTAHFCYPISLISQNDGNIYAHELLYKIYKKKGNFLKALMHLEKTDSLKEDRAGYNLKKAVTETEIRYKTSEKDKEIIAKNLELEKSHNKQILYSAVIIISFLILGYTVYSLKRGQKNKIQSLKKGQEISNLKAMIEGEEKERTRLAGELHDGIGSMLAVAQLNIDNILDDSQNLDELKEVRKHLNKTAKEVRNVAHNLVPHILQDNSLQEALYLYCDNLMSNGKLKIDIQAESEIPAFNENIKLILYRIIQELLQNAIKHAQATQIYIQIRVRHGKLLIFVEDNGKGFNPEIVNYGLAIHNIDLRVKALKGNFDIQSDEEFGSIFSISFDFNTLEDFKIYKS